MADLLLDADVIIWFLRGDRKTVELMQKIHREETLSCSVITLFEVKAGMRLQEREVTEAFLNALTHFNLTAEIADQAAAYYRTLRAKGVTVDLPDLLLSATAKIHSMVIVTYNRVHFPISDLRLYPVSPPEGKPHRKGRLSS